MGCGTRTVYPGKRNKRLSLTFQPPEEGRSVQQPKRYDKYGGKEEDNSLKNVNNVHNTSFQKYRQIQLVSLSLSCSTAFSALRQDPSICLSFCILLFSLYDLLGLQNPPVDFFLLVVTANWTKIPKWDFIFRTCEDGAGWHLIPYRNKSCSEFFSQADKNWHITWGNNVRPDWPPLAKGSKISHYHTPTRPLNFFPSDNWRIRAYRSEL